MQYIRVEQPADSWEENPCWDCCFGKEDGKCHAPIEIIDNDETCGYSFYEPNFIYKEIE